LLLLSLPPLLLRLPLVVLFLPRTRSLVLIAHLVKAETTVLVEKADPLVKTVRFVKVVRVPLAEEKEEIARRRIVDVLMSSRKTRDSSRSQSALMSDAPELVDPAMKTRREELERATGVRLDPNSKVLNPPPMPLSKPRKPLVRLRLRRPRKKHLKPPRF